MQIFHIIRRFLLSGRRFNKININDSIANWKLPNDCIIFAHYITLTTYTFYDRTLSF